MYSLICDTLRVKKIPPQYSHCRHYVRAVLTMPLGRVSIYLKYKVYSSCWWRCVCYGQKCPNSHICRPATHYFVLPSSSSLCHSVKTYAGKLEMVVGEGDQHDHVMTFMFEINEMSHKIGRNVPHARSTKASFVRNSRDVRQISQKCHIHARPEEDSSVRNPLNVQQCTISRH